MYFRCSTLIFLLQYFDISVVGFVIFFGYCVSVLERYCTSAVNTNWCILPSPCHIFNCCVLCIGVGAVSGRDMSTGDDGVGYRPITHNIQGDSDSDAETDRSSLLHSSIQSEARHLINTNDAPKDR